MITCMVCGSDAFYDFKIQRHVCTGIEKHSFETIVEYPKTDYPKNSLDEGVKHDQEKLPIHLIPVEAIQALGRTLRYGAKKYGDRNWEKGIAASRLYAATIRHLLDWWSGNELDESGLSHLDHALTSLSMLVSMMERRKDLDDRPITKEKEKTK